MSLAPISIDIKMNSFEIKFQNYKFIYLFNIVIFLRTQLVDFHKCDD